MTQLRVLNIISELNNAGTEASVMNYYRHMDRSKIQFDFLVLNEGVGYYEEEIRQLGGNVYKIPGFTSNPIKCVLARRKFFKQHHYDVVEVHAPTVHRCPYAVLARKNGTKKVIFHIHNACSSDGTLVRMYRKKLKKYATQLVACGQYAGEVAYGHDEFDIVYNAIDADKYRFDQAKRNRIREKYNIADNDFVVGQVGRYSKVKNQEFTLNVLAELVKKNSTVKMMMKGFGEDEEYLKQLADQLGITDHVVWCAKEEAVSDCYSAMDLFVLPSLFEGLPLVLIEAQFNGLHCVVSDKVSSEVNIFDQITFLPLDKALWVDIIEKGMTKQTRIAVNDKMIENTNYSIETEAKKRGQYYLA